ncbi:MULTISPECIES: patatin-like phospholipase family protein [unclassified Moraxella]|uniref:patatin-like phospholipase family protein n=1 Tax=unclassified Moraxella TaxID=2685852 RepID=UPI003AF83C61
MKNISITLLTLMVLPITACTLHPTPTQATLPNNPPTPPKPKIALVLGGGGAKGFAHIGMLKVLEKNGIKPDLIVGTSVGSLVGSLSASGKSANDIEDIATHVSNAELLDFTLSKQGIIEGVQLQNWVNTQVGGRKIEQLPIRFASIATNLSTTDLNAQKMVFTTGDTGLAVRASSSVKNVFIPPRIQNQRYGDGGLVSLVPVKTAKDLGAKVVIAVDLSMPVSVQDDSQMDFWALLDKGLGVMPKQPSAELALADVVIRPQVGNVGTTDTVNRERIIKAGETATEQKIAEIKRVVGKN